MVANATIRHGRGILANLRVNHGLATRVIIDEVGHIMNNTDNDDQRTTVALGLLLIVIPFQNRQLVQGNSPNKQTQALLVTMGLEEHA